MPYINRDKDGNVVGCFQKPQQNASEFLKPDNAEVTAYKQAKESRYAEGLLIQEEINNQARVLAIKQLKTDGKLSQYYVDPTI